MIRVEQTWLVAEARHYQRRGQRHMGFSRHAVFGTAD